MMQLKTFNRKELEDFISSGDFEQYDFLPITRHRAVSQINNPKALDDQTLLILAFDDEKLIGYVGCFPDYFIVDGKTVRYAWLSTLYANPAFRKKRPAKALLKRVFEEYEGRIVITEFTREAEALYNIAGAFDYVFPKEGKRYYFRTDAATIIPEKNPGTQKYKPFFKVLDAIANFFISAKNVLIKKPDFHYEILSSADQESVDFINEFPSHRTAEEINVFIENPWVLEGDKDDRYLFSSYARTFRFFWVKIFDENNKLTTCFLLQLRDGYLKIPYLFTQTDQSRIIRFLNYFIVKNKVKALTSYHTELNEAIKGSKTFPKIHERTFKREYLFHQQLLRDLPKDFNPYYQDGDGDCMMT
ncbi:GNAT family N-acetyltransferase [Chryseobacterium indologenes]|uniref:GNAT family N-acetyltransferase n=2 Tax=Weeksellaceae TaxID=2762318 RepID=UPI001626E24B|nr:GNAT family N-acetyltransferase [Chryseobacterium indologenes]